MGIFSEQLGEVFATYRVELQFRDKVMGGVPKDPNIIEGWLRSKAGIQQEEEVRQAMLRTLIELGAEVTPEMSYEELSAASKALAVVKNTNGFKRDSNGLYLESRIIKAAIKEVTSVLYAGDKWLTDWKVGYNGKAARSVAAERVFVTPDKVYLDRQEPDGIDLFIGHITGAAGRTSNMTYYEYVQEARIAFDLLVAEDGIPHAAWPRLWVHAQENGLGALRSQGHGRFDIEAFQHVSGPLWVPRREKAKA